MKTVKRKIWRIVKITGGFSLIFLGIIGLFLPILQGILMIIAGSAILESENIFIFFKKNGAKKR